MTDFTTIPHFGNTGYYLYDTATSSVVTSGTANVSGFGKVQSGMALLISNCRVSGIIQEQDSMLVSDNAFAFVKYDPGLNCIQQTRRYGQISFYDDVAAILKDSDGIEISSKLGSVQDTFLSGDYVNSNVLYLKNLPLKTRTITNSATLNVEGSVINKVLNYSSATISMESSISVLNAFSGSCSITESSYVNRLNAFGESHAEFNGIATDIQMHQHSSISIRTGR